MIKPAYSVSFLLSINIFVWQNVLYFLDAPRINHMLVGNLVVTSLLKSVMISTIKVGCKGLKCIKIKIKIKTKIYVISICHIEITEMIIQ